MLSEWGELPIYYPEDAEVYIKVADMPDGTLFCTLFNLGLDELENIPLVCEKEVKNVKILNSEGEFWECDFTSDRDRITVMTSARTLEPIIMFIS